MTPLPLRKVKGALVPWVPALALVVLGAAGCIDPRADYDEFATRPQAQREGGTADVEQTPCQDLLKGNANGRFFGSCLVKAVMLPFALSIQQTVRPDGNGTAELDMSFFALTTTAMTLDDTAGDNNIVPTTTLDSECRFRQNIGTLTLPAAANSLQRDLVAENVILRGKLQSADRSCSELDGNVPLVGLSLADDGDVCVYMRASADGSLPTVSMGDYVCDPSMLLPR